MIRFEYTEPQTIEEAALLLSSEGLKNRIIAGGTDILVKIHDRVVAVDRLISLAKIPGLCFIDSTEDQVRVGAMTRLAALERSALVQQSLPVLYDGVKDLGSVQIRNVATVGGNICNAVPSADTIPPLLALGAEVSYWSSGQVKTRPLSEFFVGPGETLLGRGDILVDVRFKRPPLRASGYYLKLSRRKGMDIPLLGIAVQVKVSGNGSFCEDIRIALGVAGPTPLRAERAEGLLRGERLTDELLRLAGEVASQDAKPRDSFRCNAEYRRAMIKTLLPEVVKRALLRIGKTDEDNDPV